MIDQAEIHRKAISDREVDRKEAAESLGLVFSYIIDKVQAWQDLIGLTQDLDCFVRYRAADALRLAFLEVPDRDQAWQDLHKLTQDEDEYVRGRAADALGLAYSQIPNRDQAWQDLHKLVRDQDSDVRYSAADALGLAFSYVPDKYLAWQDLHRLTQDQDSSVQGRSADALGLAYSQIPNKDLAWQDLHRLAQDKDKYVRGRAADALGLAYSQIPNRDQAWQDLHKLAHDEDEYVRGRAAYVIGLVFSQVYDKDHAWGNLRKLAKDQDSRVRMYAYHSLGRASVHEAAESEDINALQGYLEDAVVSFENSVDESQYSSPARFCYPFYRSYFAITFQAGSQEVVQKYLKEAREAVGGSESRDELLKAVENLAGALQEAQRLKDRPLPEVLRDLKTYEWYCTQAEKHMTTVEDKAPGAVNLLKRCTPQIKKIIEATISEIQDIARQICQVTHDKGPEAKAFCGQIKEAAGSLSSEDLTETLRTISDFVSFLKEKSQKLPEGDKELVQAQLDSVDRVGAIPEKLNGIKTVAYFLLSRIQKDDEILRRLGEIQRDIKSLRQSLLDRFELSEQKILSSVFERLDKDKLEIVEALLNVVEKNAVPRGLIIETLNATKDLVSEIRARQLETQDSELSKSLHSWEEAMKSPELNIENMLKVTIPIIPFLLTYEGSYKFDTGMKLDTAWNKLRALVRR